jgi:uncharacterized protein
MQLALRLCLFALLCYGACCLALFVFQRALIYFPQPRAFGGEATTLHLPVAGADLIVSVRPHAGPKALVYFGGNAEDVSVNLASFAAAFPDRAIYLLHYRGYGGSSGKPTEAALHADAQALFDHVQQSHTEIAAVGRSLGSGVAIHLARERPVSPLVLVTPYDSIEAVGVRRYPYFPVRWLITDKFDSCSVAPAIRAPTLLLVAETDAVVPRAHTDRLRAAFAPGIATAIVVPGTDHQTISHTAQYLEAMRAAL